MYFLHWNNGMQAKQQLKIPQEAVFASEEAEALPAESDCLKRKSNSSLTTQYIDDVHHSSLLENILGRNMGKS